MGNLLGISNSTAQSDRSSFSSIQHVPIIEPQQQESPIFRPSCCSKSGTATNTDKKLPSSPQGRRPKSSNNSTRFTGTAIRKLKFGCKQCTAIFQSKLQRDKHQRRGHGVHIICRYCRNTFTNIGHRKQHEQKMHKPQMGGFPCRVCNVILPSVCKEGHERKAHLRRIKCGRCEVWFTNDEYKRRHEDFCKRSRVVASKEKSL